MSWLTDLGANLKKIVLMEYKIDRLGDEVFHLRRSTSRILRSYCNGRKGDIRKQIDGEVAEGDEPEDHERGSAHGHCDRFFD